MSWRQYKERPRVYKPRKAAQEHGNWVKTGSNEHRTCRNCRSDIPPNDWYWSSNAGVFCSKSHARYFGDY